MEAPIVGHAARDAHPARLQRLHGLRCELVARLYRAHLDGTLAGEPIDVLVLPTRSPGLAPTDDVPGFERLRVGCVGHLELVLEALFEKLEGDRHVEDRPTVLDRNDAARREGAPVPDSIHNVEQRYCWIAGPQKVGVQRVGVPLRVLDRA